MKDDANRLVKFASMRDFQIVRRASSTRALLSVVVPSYNTKLYIGDAISSVLGQTFRDLELIVIDDGSTDGSVERILEFDDQRLTLVRQPNCGLAASRNIGIALSRGRYIGFLDSDDTWFPEKAMKHIQLMESAPEIGLTFSWSEYLTEAGTRTGQLLISRCNEPSARQLALRNHVGNGSTPVVRAECLDQVGGFRADIPGCEDWEMWVRLALLDNCRCRLIPEVLTGYRVRSSSMSFNFEGANNFILSGTKAVAMFKCCGVPGYSEGDQRRSLAELYRICSRKALSAGQRDASRKLLWRAINICPWLFLRDFRAAGLFCLHFLPQSITKFVTNFGYRSLRALATRVDNEGR